MFPLDDVIMTLVAMAGICAMHNWLHPTVSVACNYLSLSQIEAGIYDMDKHVYPTVSVGYAQTEAGISGMEKYPHEHCARGM